MPRSSRPTAFAWLATAAVVVLSVNLRPGATSLGPVLSEVQQSFAFSHTVSGLVVALPGLCFAVFGGLAATVARRFGVPGAIALGVVALTVGLLVRSLVSDGTAFVGLTVVAFAGMAMGNVLLPAFIQRHFPRRTAPLMAVYGSGLAVGATVAALIAVPLAGTSPEGWRVSLGVWGVAAAVAGLPWLWLARAESRDASGRGSRPGSLLDLIRSPTAVGLALFFGVQSMQAYVQFGWIAQVFREGGLDPTTAGALTSLIAALGIPAGLAMPILVARLPDLRPLVVAFGVLLVIGYLGVLHFPTTLPWLWALCLGLSGAAFPTALALITARTRDPHVTTRVSAFTQSIGYTLAAAGPFLVGWLVDVTGGWTVPLLLLAGSSVVMVAGGLLAVRPTMVDDQLPSR